jgi:glycosyltransferase involved in cell wall biosynthesis
MRKYLFVMAQVGHPWGGSEPLWSSAAEKLARQGNEVRVTVKDWGEPVPQIEKLRLAGCQIFYRDNRPPSFVTRQIRKVFPVAEYSLRHLRSIGDGADLAIISQGSNSDGLVWIEAARRAGYKYAVIAHSAVVYWWPPDDEAERLAESYEAASAAYFVSHANLELSRRQFGSELRNGKVVRNPFNVRYDAQPPWPSSSSEELKLACVGRLDVISKAQDVLLQVLALPHWLERKIKLSLIGEGPHERGLRRMVDQLKLRNVEFAGHQNNVEEIWSRHHALVLPSRFEGMPLTVVEAMLCARVCIATDVGGNRELIRDGVNGFLAAAPTVELLDEAMNRAWENRNRLREMGCRAAQDVREWVSEDPGADFARELASLVERGD